ncbi:Serine protease inhibitor Kazal-type 5 [Phlyctochytrium bullatum]|nr:Serine protease inhibitor Kazal-type 5 [Phlyctochytrium bullatum]
MHIATTLALVPLIAIPTLTHTLHPRQSCDASLCPTTGPKVCGTNGKTYDNACLLAVAACTLPYQLKVAAQGTCIPPGPLKNNCDPNMCREVTTPKVCGDDHVTYANECMLNVAKCTNQTLTTAYEGVCIECDPSMCRGVTTPEVCGSDGVSYGNECFLRVARCKDAGLVKVADGKCATEAASSVGTTETATTTATTTTTTTTTTTESATSAVTTTATLTTTATFTTTVATSTIPETSTLTTSTVTTSAASTTTTAGNLVNNGAGKYGVTGLFVAVAAGALMAMLA